MPKDQFITKASGERVFFDVEKLRHSLKKSGADNQTVDAIVNNVVGRLYEGISTKDIYTMAFTLLRDKHAASFAARYKLKNAIMELGPSGYPFEKYFSEILRYQGYSVQISQILQGRCVTHEIDVIARFDHGVFFIECKYHNGRGTLTDVKTPLYINSRFEDVKFMQEQLPENKNKQLKGWVVTNTHFSDDAIQYGRCVGLELVGWDYPKGNSLKEQIDRTGLHPITCLTTLTKNEKANLLDAKIVLCRELAEKPAALTAAGITKSRIHKITDEALQLCR